MLGKLLSKGFLQRFSQSYSIVRFGFAASRSKESTAEDDTLQVDRQSTFYRNSIRRININDKGRGKFTQHHLIKLIKLTENPSQIPLLFEGYYNYLGHFTVISSTTVDKMLVKVMSFEETPVQSILELYSNHNYLSYFPNYHITHKLLNIVSKDEELLYKFINILSVSPLIKIDQDITMTLLHLLKQQSLTKGNFSAITKLLIQRSTLNILPQPITPKTILTHIVQNLKNRLLHQHNAIKTNSYIIQFITAMKEQEQETSQLHEQIATLAFSFGIRDIFVEHFFKLESSNLNKNFIKYLQNCSASYRNSVIAKIDERQPNEKIVRLIEPLRKIKVEEQAQAEEGSQQ